MTTQQISTCKKKFELLASNLNEKKLLEQGFKGLLLFSQEQNLVFCNEIWGLLEKISLFEYFPDDWRLLIDSSKWSLKRVIHMEKNMVQHKLPTQQNWKNNTIPYHSFSLWKYKIWWTSMNDLYVSKWQTFSLASKVAMPNILASCASGIAKTKHSTELEKCGLREKTRKMGGNKRY